MTGVVRGQYQDGDRLFLVVDDAFGELVDGRFQMIGTLVDDGHRVTFSALDVWPPVLHLTSAGHGYRFDTGTWAWAEVTT